MEKVGLVLAGGAARGAYEAGVLEVLLPELERLGQRPTVIVGTSAGALHAAYLASRADVSAKEVMAEAVELWENLELGDVSAPIGRLRTTRKLLRYLRGVTGFGRAEVYKLLDPEPMRETLRSKLQLPISPAAMARLEAAAVVATSASTSRSVVFMQGGKRPEPDDSRGIDYLPTTLAVEHVLASAAIPILFPAVRLDESPPGAPGSGGHHWYFDGGTRLNAPIKPALELGAERVVVIALNSVQQQSPAQRPNPDEQPDVADGLLQLLQAALVDPLVQDMEDLKKKNELKKNELERNELGREQASVPYDEVPFIFIGPQNPYEVGQIASDAYEPYARKHLDQIAMLGRFAGTRGGPVHGEAMSYSFFASPFTKPLLQRGREHAQQWLDSHPADNPWET